MGLIEKAVGDLSLEQRKSARVAHSNTVDAAHVDARPF